MRKVLLIEPDPDLGSTIRDYLVKRDLKIFQAANAQEAILQADKHCPDLVVLELSMPKNNGIAFLQEFRTYKDWVNIPVIVYSIVPPEEIGLSKEAWQKLGVKKYLYKPTNRLAELRYQILNTDKNIETI